jgi:molybdopterin/thiamine biosynthesis adenylyltransferase/3-mercaptopyruvate sulfurtransferase SseA
MTTKTRPGDRAPRLVEAAWLASHIESPSFRLMDVRAELPDFEIGYRWGHIPGAVHLDMHDLFTELDGVPGRLVGQSTAERVLGRLGLSRQTPVVVYDESFGPLAAQLAWLLAYYGQPDVQVLAGGWEAWEATGGPVSAEPVAPEPGLYVAEPDDTALATAHWVAAHLEHPGLVLLDTRTEAEYARGHLPGAPNLSYEESLSYNPTPGLRPSDELRRRFAEMGVTPEKEVVVYCQSGARSAHTWLVLRHLGYPRVRNYEGSWAEWSRRPELPVVGEREPASTSTPEAGKQPAAPIGPCGLPLAAPARVTPISRDGQLSRRSRDQVVAEARGQISETDVASLRARLDADEPMVVIDIRERDEWEQGHIPGAHFIPRGFLELQVEDLSPDRDAPLVVYCAGGVRSALGALALRGMGYRRVESLVGGFGAWKSAGLPFVVPTVLNETQRIRYSRHALLQEVGEAGQIKLLESKVLLVGAGGLGSPAALYLAAAGVGTLGIVDGDVVDLSNLHRQILHKTEDVGRPKTESAADTLRGINPDVQVIGHQTLLTSSNAREIISGYDLVLNGCDNFPTCYLVNDACVLAGVPVVDGSIFQFEGQVTVYDPARGGPCYRCLYPDPPPPGEVPSCAEAGVLGVLPGIVGALQALEAIKLILGRGEPLIGRLLVFDALALTFRELKLARDPACPVCGERPTLRELIDYHQFCGLPQPADEISIVPAMAGGH